LLINIKTNSAVNVRSGPGMGFEVVNTYPSGYILQEKEKISNYKILSNSGSYSIFQFQDDVIRFMTSPRLEKYQKVLEWDAGYLVVIAKYKDLAAMEEYIDLVPILEDLSYDVDSFLSHIKEVKIRETTG